MRADARRNRERIVTAALDLFTERGPGVSMDEIAQAAGLGVGTLYRHFPDRRALVDDLATSTLKGLRDHIRAQTSENVSRWEVLLRVVRYCAGQPLALITSLAGSPPVPPFRAELVREIDELLADIARQAEQEGSIRRDITPEQVVDLLNVMVCRPGARFDDPLTTVMLDGLRAVHIETP
ncbi:MAG: putative TetR-family transcriptional regulator [Sphaerisporangium sp.]|nr:putative TetR-family transcriptional regulator [Sphaerisporangium sp.]